MKRTQYRRLGGGDYTVTNMGKCNQKIIIIIIIQSYDGHYFQRRLATVEHWVNI